jgi:glycosyltransferase involved in cell wall biosynthesis
MVLSGTDSAKNYLDFFLKEGNYVLENAADDMFFDNYRGKCSNLLKDIVDIKSSKYCFSCANYTVVKNQKEMLREFYKTSANDLALVCVGSTNNSYYQDCLRLCSELEQQYGHHEVHLLHHIDRKLIPLLESNASIYLVSSIWEEYSISIIEAMAQGVPFISTNVGNARILPGGITLDCIDDMHVAIDDLIKNGNLYTSLSEKGKQFAYSHCRQSVAVKTLENIINNTLK